MIRVGIDLVNNRRFSKYAENFAFLKKVFNASELKHKQKIAGIFALKEACMKALGKKVGWKEIEVVAGGKPKVSLSDEIRPQTLKCIDASISHDGDYTIGIVIMELG